MKEEDSPLETHALDVFEYQQPGNFIKTLSVLKGEVDKLIISTDA